MTDLLKPIPYGSDARVAIHAAVRVAAHLADQHGHAINEIPYGLQTLQVALGREPGDFEIMEAKRVTAAVIARAERRSAAPAVTLALTLLSGCPRDPEPAKNPCQEPGQVCADKPVPEGPPPIGTQDPGRAGK